ncbi:hypothetical protein PUN28_007999 [Cardiocondyla obscurior]|uniref:Uncharacterized protein n=1 Tax=Cardiocondyla obscurior TaxID=286306 RepID=A0AAW2FXN0_9HYME
MVFLRLLDPRADLTVPRPRTRNAERLPLRFPKEVRRPS